jgi:hypothetical protein
VTLRVELEFQEQVIFEIHSDARKMINAANEPCVLLAARDCDAEDEHHVEIAAESPTEHHRQPRQAGRICGPTPRGPAATRPGSRPAVGCGATSVRPVSTAAAASLVPLGSKRIRAMNPRAMKRAMKSEPPIGQINQHTAEQIVKFPEFPGAPGRIRTCDARLKRPGRRLVRDPCVQRGPHFCPPQ